MQQLTPQDAVFLSMETPELPTHVGGLAFLRPTEGVEFSFERFIDFVRERLGSVDRFSWQLQEVPLGLDRPYWVKRKNFDPADHVHSIRIPAPYTAEALSKLVGRIFERPMDRSRPLWDMVLIEGLPGDRHVMLWRMHHCLMDGSSGASLSEQLFDVTSDATRSAPVVIEDTACAGEPVPNATLFTNAVRNASELPIRQSKHIARALRTALEDALNDVPEPASAEEAESKASGGLAPTAPWNGVVGRHRGIAWSSVSLDEVKAIKHSLGVSVNDVVLAITGGALRGYLEERDALPEASLVASVPCSMRSTDDTSLGNQLREMPIHWATDIEDPLARTAIIHDAATRAKQDARDGRSLDLIGMLSDSLLPGALQLLMRGAAIAGDRMPLPANAVVSNVPMAPFPLYCAGARIEQVVPISLLAPTQGLNITVLGYDGQLYFGLVHDPELVPDAWDMAGRIPKNLQALQSALDERLEADPLDAN